MAIYGIYRVVKVGKRMSRWMDNANTHADRYRVEARGVFYEGRPIPGADPATFSQLGKYYAKDNNSVFYCSSDLVPDFSLIFIPIFRKSVLTVRMETADPGTFAAIGDLHGKDLRAAYYKGEKIPGADPGTFEEVDAFFAKDKRSVYHGLDVLPESDGRAFRALGYGYYGDQRSLWRYDVKLAIPRASSVTALGNSYFKSDRHVYYLGDDSVPVMMDADIATFEVCAGQQYAKDAYRVFYKNRIVPEADPRSFQSPARGLDDVPAGDPHVNLADAKDGRRYYYMGEALSPEK